MEDGAEMESVMIPTRRDAAVDLAIVLAAITAAWASSRWVIYPALGIPDYAPYILRPITGFLVAWWVLHWRGASWASLGLRKPSPLWLAAAITVVAYLVELALWQWVVPVLAEWFQPTRRPSFLGHLRGNTAALAFWIAIAWFVGGVCEECLFRGFLLTRVETLCGGGRIALAAGVLAQAALFGTLHLYGGTFAFMYAALFGVVYAMFYLLAGRNLWPVLIVHAVVDSVAFWDVYNS
jgi:membrane protease YdiL (CAAX protease family)